MRFHVLGPLVVRDHDGTAVRLASRRQRVVLSRLLIADGQVVPAERILEDVWGEVAGPGALGALQTTISLLRRALEPDRPPRAPAQLLISATPGYALRTVNVDARDFEEQLRQGDLAAIDRGLALWQGPAYAEVAHLPWAQAEVTRLDELRLAARERRAALLIDQGDTTAATGDLEGLLADAPLREEAWRLLALALYRAGRQGDALAALRRARSLLADELGVDPGPRLREVETAILEQAASLDLAPATPRPTVAVAAPVPHETVDTGVGRNVERRQLVELASEARLEGVPRIALVGGSGGIGKTWLADTVSSELATQGWRTVWGRCPETAGAPALWPWTQILEQLTEPAPPTPEERSGLDLDQGDRGLSAPDARFRLLRTLSRYLARVARDQPLLVVLDDLHRADEATLAAIREIVMDREGGPLCLLGTFRSEEVTPDLLDTLATVAAAGGLRLELGGLTADEVATLVQRVCAHAGVPERAATDAIDGITQRTEGNPFYVVESARLLASEGPEAAQSNVPAGVADVVRRRLLRLPAPTQSVLQTVAVIGRDADVRVVVRADVHEDEVVLDALESAVVAGLLSEPSPGMVRFSHAVVRDTIYGDLPRLRRARAHARAAEGLEQHRPDDVTTLAHHYTEAAALGHAGEAIRWSQAAAEQAERGFSHRAAMGWWQRAREVAELNVHDVDPRVRAEVLIGLARAQQLAGHGVDARRTRAQAIDASAPLEDDLLTARAITSIDAPLLWSNRAHGEIDLPLIEQVTETLRRLADGDAAVRARLLAALALESGIWHDPDGARQAADEAVSLARRDGDPEVIAVALNAAYYANRMPSQLSRVTEVGADLVALGVEHRMPGVEALGHLAVCVEPGARGDVEALVDRAERVADLARTYDLPHVAAMAELQRAARLSIREDLATATRAYEELGQSAMTRGMYDVTAVTTIGRICLHHVHGRLKDAAEQIDAVLTVYPTLAAPMKACLLAAEGDLDGAATLLRTTPPPAHDYLMTMLEAFRGDAAVAAGCKDVAADVYARLLPYEDLVCGGETNAMPVGPVALRLARIAELLGQQDAARRHWQRADDLVRRAGAPAWNAMLTRTAAD